MMELVLANNRRLFKNCCAKFWNFFEYLKNNYFSFNCPRDPGVFYLGLDDFLSPGSQGGLLGLGDFL
jgi:hypothetical protein